MIVHQHNEPTGKSSEKCEPDKTGGTKPGKEKGVFNAWRTRTTNREREQEW